MQSTRLSSLVLNRRNIHTRRKHQFLYEWDYIRAFILFSLFFSCRNKFIFTITLTLLYLLFDRVSMCICTISRIFSAFHALRIYEASVKIISRMSNLQIADKRGTGSEYRQNYMLCVYIKLDTCKRTPCPISWEKKLRMFHFFCYTQNE